MASMKSAQLALQVLCNMWRLRRRDWRVLSRQKVKKVTGDREVPRDDGRSVSSRG
jgi:hypothetical protein